jgi:hypothetical protein
MGSSICVLPAGVIDQPPFSWEVAAGLPGVTEFGTDPYWQAFGIESTEERDPFIDAQAGAAIRASRQAGVPCMLWIQAFRVAASREADLIEGARRIIKHGPETVAIWGYEACAHMSELACERPTTVWQRLIDLVRPGRCMDIEPPSCGGRA